MPPILRSPSNARPGMGSTLVEYIRRYSGSLTPAQLETVAAILVGDTGPVNPGIIPPRPPAPPDPLDLLGLLSDEPPPPIGPVSLAGTESLAMRADATHEGLHSLAKLGSMGILGDATMSVEGLLTLAQVANNLHLTLTLADILQARTIEQYQLIHSHSLAFRLLYRPLGDVEVYFAGKRKHRTLHYNQAGQVVTLANSVQLVDGDLVTFQYWADPAGGS